MGSGSSTGEEVVEDVDLARSGESVTVANHKVGETEKGYKLPNFDNDKDKDKDAQSSLDETKEKRMKTSNNDQRIESRLDDIVQFVVDQRIGLVFFFFLIFF